MNFRARLLGSDPLGVAAPAGVPRTIASLLGQSQLALQCQRGLSRHESLLRSNPASKALVQAASLCFANTRDYFDAGLAEPFEAAAGTDRIGILGCRDDARDARRDDRFGTRAGASLVATWLERHVKNRAARFFLCRFERHDFRVVSPFILMKAFADDSAVTHNDASNGRIRAGQSDALVRQLERVLHKVDVVFVHDLIEKRSEE